MHKAPHAFARTRRCVAGQGNIRTSKTATNFSGQSSPATPNASDSCTASDRTKWFILRSNARFKDGEIRWLKSSPTRSAEVN